MSIRKLFSAIALSLCFAVSSFAAWPYDAVGDIACYTGGQAFGGSGTLVGKSKDKSVGLIVSCAHIFDEGYREVTIKFPTDPTKYTCTKLYLDFERDISVWSISPAPDIRTPLAVTKVRPDEGPFTAVGFPGYGQGAQHYSTGDFISYDSNGYEAYVNSDVHSGFSGGALFNKRGEFAGIVCGNTPLVMGQPARWGIWESRHTTGDPFLNAVDDYVPVRR